MVPERRFSSKFVFFSMISSRTVCNEMGSYNIFQKKKDKYFKILILTLSLAFSCPITLIEEGIEVSSGVVPERRFSSKFVFFSMISSRTVCNEMGSYNIFQKKKDKYFKILILTLSLAFSCPITLIEEGIEVSSGVVPERRFSSKFVFFSITLSGSVCNDIGWYYIKKRQTLIYYSRVPNKRGAIFINFCIFFQGLRSH